VREHAKTSDRRYLRYGSGGRFRVRARLRSSYR
jgi:hypothetical protein